MTTQGAMRILLVEDNPGDARLLRERLAEGGSRFELTHVDRLSAGLECLAKSSFEVVLLDLSLPDSQGQDTVLGIRAASKSIPIVVLTGVEDEELGVRLIQAGAQDYFVKGQVTGPLLTRSLRYAAERARMEEALRQSEKRLRAIMDNSPALMFLKDMEGHYLLVNRKFEEVFHLQSRNLLGKTDEEIFPSEQAAAFRANDRKVLEAGTAMEFEEVVLHDDGPHTSIAMKFPLHNAQGQCYAIGGVATDITDRKRVEEAHARLAAIVESSHDAIVSVSRGLITSWNPAAERLFGYSAQEILGNPVNLLAPPHRSEEQERIFERVSRGERVQDFETTRWRKDGSLVDVALTVFPVKSAEGHIIGYSGIVRDITDRKRAEEERQKLLSDKLLLLESTGEGIYGVDLQGRCTFVNKAAARMLGYQPDELLGQNMHGLVHHHRLDGSPYRSEECRIYGVLLSGRGVHVDDEVMWRKDGTAFPVVYSSFPVREQERITGAVVAFTDITDRKRTEEQLRDTLDRARTLSQRVNAVREEERTRIARELHDELGVRLTCLKLDLARLQSVNGKPSLTPHKMAARIRSMTAEVDATIVSVQGLVAELRPGVLDDLGLVAAIEWQCQDFERRSGIRCCCEARKGDIQLDRPQATAAFRICQEALTNVARHAKATSIRVLVEQLNGDLLLEIQDNGRGIPVEKLTDSASLGLLGMRERAASLGGRIEISGQPGKGTTVMLRLPRSEQADK
jgi:PAS domain S-box-containing protein